MILVTMLTPDAPLVWITVVVSALGTVLNIGIVRERTANNSRFARR
jgi:hypothetical protein